MVNYQLGKIYKIVDNTNGHIYIGSTCEPNLSRRLTGHKGKYTRYLNGLQHYVSSFEILKNGDYDIVLLENYQCEDKMQLHSRERFYIDSLDCVNKYRPTRTKKEYDHQYRQENKEKISERVKQYAIDHKDQINEKRRELLLKNKEQINAKRRENYKLKKEMNIIV